MAEPKKEDFLDDISDYEYIDDQEELINIDEEVAQFDEIDAIRAERDDYRDKFMRALADAENARKRAERLTKEDVKFELALMNQLNHPNIVKVYDAIEHDCYVTLVLEQ